MCNRLKEAIVNVFKKLVAMCNRLKGLAKVEVIKELNKKNNYLNGKIRQGLYSEIRPAGSKLSRRFKRRRDGISNTLKCYM
jgi:hypothetical protein